MIKERENSTFASAAFVESDMNNTKWKEITIHQMGGFVMIVF